MRVDNSMLINVLAREEDAFPVLRRLLTDNHEDPAHSSGWPAGRCGWRASWCGPGSLTRLDELDEFGRRYVLTVDLPDGLRPQPAARALRAGRARRARPGGGEHTSTSCRSIEAVLEGPGRSCSPSSTPPAARRSTR